MTQEIKAVVLAAGKSKRMKSDFTKMAHRVLGKEIINYLLDSLTEAGIKEENIILVVGDNREEIEAVVKRRFASRSRKSNWEQPMLSWQRKTK